MAHADVVLHSNCRMSTAGGVASTAPPPALLSLCAIVYCTLVLVHYKHTSSSMHDGDGTGDVLDGARFNAG